MYRGHLPTLKLRQAGWAAPTVCLGCRSDALRREQDEVSEPERACTKNHRCTIRDAKRRSYMLDPSSYQSPPEGRRHISETA